MNLWKLNAWFALSTIICAALLALLLIIAIWLEMESLTLWKFIGTVLVLFFLSACIQAIMQGIIPKSEQKQ